MFNIVEIIIEGKNYFFILKIFLREESKLRVRLVLLLKLLEKIFIFEEESSVGFSS